MEELPNLLTQGGIAVVVLLLIGVVRTTLPDFDVSRYGPILAIVLGIVLAIGANATQVADTQLTILEVALTGLLGGASAVGIFGAGRGTTTALGDSNAVATEKEPPAG